MADLQEVLALSAPLLIFLFFILTLGVRRVRQNERLVILRLGVPVAVKGPGISLKTPLVDRAVVVEIPSGYVAFISTWRPATGLSYGPDIPGLKGISLEAVCKEAALMAVRADPSARRAGGDLFRAALKEVGRRKRAEPEAVEEAPPGFEVTYSSFEYEAKPRLRFHEDVGVLRVDDGGLLFEGKRLTLRIPEVLAVFLVPTPGFELSRVMVVYRNGEGRKRVAYFAARARFGDLAERETRRMYEELSALLEA